MKKLFLTLSSLFILTSCTDAKRAKLLGYGDEFKIELVNCDGSITHSWITTGKVISEGNSDWYYFNDSKGNLVEVSGTLIITKI